MEEHSSKDDREPRQQEINDVVTRHAALIERSNRVLTVGGQALPIWQEYNDTTTKLLEWIIECDQKLCTAEYQSGNALVTKQSLENCKVSDIYTYACITELMIRLTKHLFTFLIDSVLYFVMPNNHPFSYTLHNYNIHTPSCIIGFIMLHKCSLGI